MHKTLIIAEAGVNHCGQIELAKRLVCVAADAGADIVKFQTYSTESLVTTSAVKAAYQARLDINSETQFEMLKRLELKKQEFEILSNECQKKQIEFLSSAFDIESLNFLIQLGIKRIKVPSGEINNLPYLRVVGGSRLPIILSTGMATLEEIDKAVNILLQGGVNKSEITLLHCNSEYPTQMTDVNLLAMPAMGNAFATKYGYSDHTIGAEIAVASVALGASVIEKHITLDCSMEGPDHLASMEPLAFTKMVKKIRNTEIALGQNLKKPTDSELKNISRVRKSIVASRYIAIGEEFNDQNITTKRPGGGISPMMWDQLIGKKASKEYQPDDFIKE